MRFHYGRLVLFLVLLLLVLSGCSKAENTNPPERQQSEQTNQEQEGQNGQEQDPEQDPEQEPEPDQNQGNKGEEPSSKLERALTDMTLEEKIGQLIVAGVAGDAPDEQAQKMISEQHVGGIIFYKYNLVSPGGVIDYVNQLKAWNDGNKAPLLISVDQEGGKVSRLPGMEKLPEAAAVGKKKDASLAAEIGELLAEECRLMGVNMNYAPVLDINSNPKNPVIGTRSFGATADIVSSMGLEEMKAIQKGKVIPVVKHFPGHGDTAVDSHLELPVVHKSLAQLQAFEWLPFQQAIAEGTDAVMIAHILFPQIDKQYPASLSKTIITDQLRGTLGFDGVVITDDLTMGAIAQNYGIGEAAVQSMKAGSDILLVAHEYENVELVIKALQESIASGELTEQRIDESVARVLKMKEKYALSDAPVSAPSLSKLNDRILKLAKQIQS